MEGLFQKAALLLAYHLQRSLHHAQFCSPRYNVRQKATINNITFTTKADKGNKIVILNEQDYIPNIETIIVPGTEI